MNIKLDHINLTVRNLEESLDWYKNLFGMEFKEGDLKNQTEPWAIVGKDDSMICMYEDPKLKSASESGDGPFHKVYHFGIRISDRDDWEKRVETHKVKVNYGGAYKYPRSVSWYIVDPSGHEIEVSYTGNNPLAF